MINRSLFESVKDTPVSALSEKGNFFAVGGYGFQTPFKISDDELARWRAEYRLLECNKCDYRFSCPSAHKNYRLPVSEGGEGQCLQYARKMLPFSFVGPFGLIIQIPKDLIQEIGEAVLDAVLREIRVGAADDH